MFYVNYYDFNDDLQSYGFNSLADAKEFAKTVTHFLYIENEVFEKYYLD